MSKSWNECLKIRILGTPHDLNKKFCAVVSHPSCCIYYACSFMYFFCTGVWTQGLHLDPLHQPIFVCLCVLWGFFLRSVLTNSLPDCIWTMIFLISALWVAVITDLRHMCLGSIWALWLFLLYQWKSSTFQKHHLPGPHDGGFKTHTGLIVFCPANIRQLNWGPQFATGR
jgi:hypothetical protein